MLEKAPYTSSSVMCLVAHFSPPEARLMPGLYLSLHRQITVLYGSVLCHILEPKKAPQSPHTNLLASGSVRSGKGSRLPPTPSLFDQGYSLQGSDGRWTGQRWPRPPQPPARPPPFGTQESVIRQGNLPLGEALPHAPRHIFGDGHALVLRHSRHDRKNEAALGIECVDIFLLEYQRCVDNTFRRRSCRRKRELTPRML